jgi:hypothetical protein
MPTLDIFKDDAFSMANLTAAINKEPYKPARIGQLGLFGEQGISTTTVMIEEKQGQLSLVPTSPRGGVPDSIGKDWRKVRSFLVPHLARRSQIPADAIQGVRAFGSETELQVIQAMVNQRLATLKSMLEVTLEYHRIGAIKGVILDADGTTPIYNLFTEFGVSQQTKNMILQTETTPVRKKCTEIARLIEDELGAAMNTGLRGFCSSTFFDDLVDHKEVKETFKYQESPILRQDLRRTGFQFGGITWEEYRGSVGGKKFVEDDYAYVFPEGVTTERGGLFQTNFAPADYFETVNTVGLPYYSKQAVDPMWQKFVDLEAQSNPLCLCLIPRAVVKVYKAGS